MFPCFFVVWDLNLMGYSLSRWVIGFMSTSEHFLYVLRVKRNQLVTSISKRLKTFKFAISLCARILLVAI